MKKRIVTIALVIALLATCFGGTIAYLTDTKAVKNTFTIGNVYITLDEVVAVKDATTGNLIASDERTSENQEYTGEKKLFPAMTVAKDPTITVNKGSDNAWVAAKITFEGYYAYALLSGGVLDADKADVVKSGNVVYIYMKEAMAAEEQVTLFTTLTIPPEWNNNEMANLNEMKINVEAYGVQANGFASCQAAMQAAFSTAFSSANP